jgi:hypothetical protein
MCKLGRQQGRICHIIAPASLRSREDPRASVRFADPHTATKTRKLPYRRVHAMYSRMARRGNCSRDQQVHGGPARTRTVVATLR